MTNEAVRGAASSEHRESPPEWSGDPRPRCTGRRVLRHYRRRVWQYRSTMFTTLPRSNGFGTT
jgi:hypothetical protein